MQIKRKWAYLIAFILGLIILNEIWPSSTPLVVTEEIITLRSTTGADVWSANSYSDYVTICIGYSVFRLKEIWLDGQNLYWNVSYG